MTSFRRLRRSLLAAIGAVAFGVMPDGRAEAAGCADLPVQGDGVVTEVVDARTLRLADGREVRLTGVEPIDEQREAGAAMLRSAALGHRVVLRGADDVPDRYGRQPAYVLLADGAELVQARLLSAGVALVGLGVESAECLQQLRAAEAAGRSAAAGAWVGIDVIKNAANSGDILSRLGRFTVVEGRVNSVREVGSTVYLNFAGRWTRGFAVTISRRMVGGLEAAGLAPKSLTGQRIRVRGWVEKRAGASIAVREAGQIERTGGD
ncbi:thermonuclease family protein [Rhodopseudomonas palustris]|uniref:Nuclease (SNase domain protein) n=1 Tax=Rhodopseudomonas palustris (strain DX-1) TaxID=652103 RepID=E6VG58_RHOPX